MKSGRMTLVVVSMGISSSLCASMQVRFDPNEVMARKAPVFTVPVKSIPQPKSSIDLTKVNSSTEKQSVSFQAIDQDLKELSDILAKLKQHVDEVRRTVQPAPQTTAPAPVPAESVAEQKTIITVQPASENKIETNSPIEAVSVVSQVTRQAMPQLVPQSKTP